MIPVIAVKLEDPPTPPKVSALLNATAGSVRVFGGLGGVSLIQELNRGASGTMTGFAFPEVLCDVWRMHASGEIDQARNLFYRHLPLILFEAQPLLSLPIRKLLYQRRGMISTPHVRAPASRVDEETTNELDRLASGIGLVWQR
jgi:4-hydroxy-tetrahydrodipicolinate synthase